MNCKYYREHKTGAYTGECLLIGRILSISGESHQLFEWAMMRLCDGWLKRPKKWNIVTSSVENPHWKDPYLSRETLQKLRGAFIKKVKKKEQAS